MFATATKLWNDEHGATAIEYGLIVALITVVVIGAYQAVGTGLTNTFNNAASSL
jgi:pilus assembly protein Flp/PilA